MPQMAGMGDPPVMMNWSKSHFESVLSGWASTMSTMSNLGRIVWLKSKYFGEILS